MAYVHTSLKEAQASIDAAAARIYDDADNGEGEFATFNDAARDVARGALPHCHPRIRARIAAIYGVEE